jgi:methylenetetrahydrofolate reductase (NADPH)
MKEIETGWQDFLADFDFSPVDGFYAFAKSANSAASPHLYGQCPVRMPFWEKLHFHLMETAHSFFFNPDAALAPLYRRLSSWCDSNASAHAFLDFAENVGKQVMLGCRQCGDCAIQHLAFQCPESGCPKHIRNGACGGSRNGRCEVHPDRWCIWHQTYLRWAYAGKTDEMIQGCIPPRKWELNRTSSWLNFHLGRDHQSASEEFARFCCSRDSCGPPVSGICNIGPGQQRLPDPVYAVRGQKR